MEYIISIENYEGPLDILYDLIVKHKIDIYEISILKITQQYLERLKEMEKMDLEITSDFIMMACKLLEMKSKYLLKRDEESDAEEEIARDFIEKIMEYKKFKNVSIHLKERLKSRGMVVCRKKEEFFVEEEFDLSNLSLEAIVEIVPVLIKKVDLLIERPFEKIYKKSMISIEEKIEFVKEKIHHNKVMMFHDLVKANIKEDIIVTFLSILELAKNKEIFIKQNESFSNIEIVRI